MYGIGDRPARHRALRAERQALVKPIGRFADGAMNRRPSR